MLDGGRESRGRIPLRSIAAKFRPPFIQKSRASDLFVNQLANLEEEAKEGFRAGLYRSGSRFVDGVRGDRGQKGHKMLMSGPLYSNAALLLAERCKRSAIFFAEN